MPKGLDALMPKERVHRLYRLRCTAPSLHIGNLMQIMRLRRLQRHGHKPIVVVGGGTTKIGDPSGKDETRQILTEAAIDANKERHQGNLPALSEVRRRPERRHHGRQCRMARQARIHSVPARRRPPLLGQPHADHGQREAAARSRAAAVLPRIQLHDPAGLRFRRALQALRLPLADGRLGPVGQYRRRHRSRAGARTMPSCSA